MAQPLQTWRAWSVVSSASSIVSALVASICCLGPLAFALLGIGGVGFLVEFEPYAPYLMAATLAFLAAGFYFTYRKPKATSAGGAASCECPAPRTNGVGKIVLWLATALALGFLGFPYVAPYLFG